MPFCPACRSEYREGFAACYDCGDALVDVLPAPPPPDISTWSPILSTLSYPRAYLVRAFLEENGIAAEVENEYAWNHAIGLPLPAIPLLVTVGDADRADALEALSAWDVREPDPEPWAPPAAPWLPPALAAALFFVGGETRVPGRLTPGVLATLAWMSIQAAILARFGALLPMGLIYGTAGGLTLIPGLHQALGVEPFFGREFLITGPLEETFKMLPAMFLSDRGLRLRCAGAAALGFATVENLGYTLDANVLEPCYYFGMRSVSLLHLALTLFVASGPRSQIIGRLFLAAFLHGAWNTMSESVWTYGIYPLVALAGWMISRTLRGSAPAMSRA